MIKAAILISGGGSNMVKLAQSMQGDHPARVALVLSNDPKAGGLAKAQALGLTTKVLDHRTFGKDRDGYDAQLHDILQSADIDVICLAGFMRILTPGFVAQWQDRLLNIHPSLLPKFKGLNTHAKALQAGEFEHGCSVHHVTAALDDGRVLGQARVPVMPDDTADTLAARVLVQEHLLYPAVFAKFCTEISR